MNIAIGSENSRQWLSEEALLRDILTIEYTNDIIYGRSDRAEQIRSILKSLKVEISPQIVMTIVCDDFWQICENLDNRSRYNIKRTILNLAREAIRNKMNALATTLIGTDKIVIILECPKKTSEENEKYAIECASSISAHIKIQSGYSVSIGVSRFYPNINRIWVAYEESFQALKQIFFYGKDSVLLYSDDFHNASSNQSLRTEPILYQKIITAIFRGNYLMIEEVVNQMMTVFTAEYYGEMPIKSEISIIVAKISQYFENIKLYDYLILERQANLIVSIFQATSLKDVLELVKKYIFGISEKISIAKHDDKKLSMDIALAFMREYYYQDLKLGDIAGMIGYSPAYFSRTFRDFFDISFVQKLSDIRIDNAKKLLENSSLPVAVISERIGFKNTSYFSTAFKKETGLSPNQYRNLVKS